MDLNIKTRNELKLYEIKYKMSLDVNLEKEKWVSYDRGKTHTIEYDTLYSANITHNLGEMADKAGIYEALWRPHRLVDGYCIPEGDYDSESAFEDSVTIWAKDIIPVIEEGLQNLKARPEYFKQFDSPNGWGTYKYFVPFVEKYLTACKQYPDSIVKVSR